MVSEGIPLEQGLRQKGSNGPTSKLVRGYSIRTRIKTGYRTGGSNPPASTPSGVIKSEGIPLEQGLRLEIPAGVAIDF